FANAHSANTWRSSNDVSRSFDRKHKRSFISEKGRRTVRRLRRYFQAHTVAILTNSPIKLALMKPEKSGHVAKWAIDLGEHDIVFRARGDRNKETTKDFLIEAPPEDNRKEVGRKTDMKLEKTKPSCEWKLYIDGTLSLMVQV
ncbi:hypothetical protein Tco_0283651, partial [Tanacetum coccineum]